MLFAMQNVIFFSGAEGWRVVWCIIQVNFFEADELDKERMLSDGHKLNKKGRDQMISISLCMIVKDEEAVLGRCLDSEKSAVDEIVIVDTGSKDRAKEIAYK